MREMLWAGDEGVKTMIYVFDIRKGAAATSEGNKVNKVPTLVKPPLHPSFFPLRCSVCVLSAPVLCFHPCH